MTEGESQMSERREKCGCLKGNDCNHGYEVIPPGDPAAPASGPTEDEINRLEKAVWDANVDHVLVWYRDQIDHLRERMREADRAAKLERQRAIRAERRDPAAPASGVDPKLLAIAGLVNGYHNDGTTLSAAETLAEIAKALGKPMEAAPASGQ